MANPQSIRDAEKQTRQETFLKHFAECGVIGTACKLTGISRKPVGDWRKASDEFEAKFQEAKQTAIDAAEQELRDRAVNGHDEIVMYKGEPVYQRDPETGKLLLDEDFNPIPFTRNTKSDRLLEVYVKAHKPEYKDKTDITLSNPDGSPVQTAVTVTLLKPGEKTDESE